MHHQGLSLLACPATETNKNKRNVSKDRWLFWKIHSLGLFLLRAFTLCIFVYSIQGYTIYSTSYSDLYYIWSEFGSLFSHEDHGYFSILTYFWSRKPELTCGPGFPRMPGNPGGPGMPCPMGTQHIKIRLTDRRCSGAKKQTHDLFSKETDRHARFLLFSHQVGPLCSVMLQRLDFACTQIQLRIK